MINSVSKPCIILVDFSIDTLATVKSTAGIDSTDRFSCVGYDSLIIISSRKTLSTATFIDYHYVKSITSINTGVLGMIVSDLDAIFYSLTDQRHVSHLRNIGFPGLSNQSLSSFKQHLSDFLESFNVF